MENGVADSFCHVVVGSEILPIPTGYAWGKALPSQW